MNKPTIKRAYYLSPLFFANNIFHPSTSHI